MRSLTEEDLDDLVELDGEFEVRKLGGSRSGSIIPADPEERRRYERERFVEPRRASTGPGSAWAGPSSAGSSSRPARDRPDEVELGYRLRRGAWGFGYAHRGRGRALVLRALEAEGYRRVFAHALEDNTASIRVMEKVGLRYVGPWSYRGLAGVGVRPRAVEGGSTDGGIGEPLARGRVLPRGTPRPGGQRRGAVLGARAHGARAAPGAPARAAGRRCGCAAGAGAASRPSSSVAKATARSTARRSAARHPRARALGSGRIWGDEGGNMCS